jgi:hypothetical protein
MSKDTGGPAFPATNHHGHKLEGMTLRDYFAAEAMQGHCPSIPPEHAAKRAYEYADAMLKAREAT